MLGIVQEIGAAAGVAAGVGLVALSALHLAHAREVKRLREWAGRAPERSRRDGIIRALRSPPWYGRIGSRYATASLVGLLVLGGAAAYGVTRLTGDHGGDSSGRAQADGSFQRSKANRPAVKPGNVTVAVLNGTTVPGLAAALSGQVTAAGFKPGAVDVYSDQQLVESVVQHAPGHEDSAKAVSRIVGVSRREPVTAGSRALAGDATVIVIAGADKAP